MAKLCTAFKQSTCPCNLHVVRRGGNQWQLEPATTVPTDVVLQLPTVSKTTILQKRAAKHGALDQASLLVETSSISSDDTVVTDNFHHLLMKFHIYVQTHFYTPNDKN